jgi:short-subunit dehydrogenase
MRNTVLIIGATSDISIELAKIYAKNNHDLILTARDPNKLNSLIKYLKINYDINVEAIQFDIINFDTHKSFYDNIANKPSIVILVSGYMTDQILCQKNFKNSLNTISVNYLGPVSILNIIAIEMKKKKHGSIVGVSSVAGERGRRKNYIYGSSKAGLSTYLSGLRNELNSFGIKILTVKPGYVKTKMTKDLKLPNILVSKPDDIAKKIFVAEQNGKDVIYSKFIWKVIIFIINLIPEFIFKRTNI